MNQRILFAILLLASVASAHNSYTGGYSGSPGLRTCALSCHGGSGGTLVVNGFPSAYVPGQTYRLTVAHVGGSPIVNFNLTTRAGSTGSVAGTFTPVSSCVLYAGTDGGIYASPHMIDSAVVNWTAPAKGAGSVTLYAAAFQGSTSSSNGQSRALSVTSTEVITGIVGTQSVPPSFSLSQNYPNPFNPGTTFNFQIPAVERVNLKIYNSLGKEVTTLLDEVRSAGTHSVRWDAGPLPSGTYFYQLRAGQRIETKPMILLR
jgi:hypothetical protein